MLNAFCAADADRYQFLCTILEWKKISYRVIDSGGKHILIETLGKKSFIPDHCRKILVAHYDRYPGSPGANDNAASVFILLNHVSHLMNATYSHNTQILFTDKEELINQSSIKDQGAWNLAQNWPDDRKGQDIFIVLDMCGIGDTLIWGKTSAKFPGVPPRRLEMIYNSLKDLLMKFSRGQDMGINDLYSDDLGFLLQGMTALQVSLLPWKEALKWKTSGMSAKSRYQDPHDFTNEIEIMPTSWQNNHSPQDSVDTLDKKSFRIMESFLKDLSRYQIPLPTKI